MNIDFLLKQHSCDCAIGLQDGAQLPFGMIYNLLEKKF